jgi:hypothetical protein
MKVLLSILLLSVLTSCEGMKELSEAYNMEQMEKLSIHKSFLKNGDKTETVEVISYGFESDPPVSDQSNHPDLMGI